MKLRIFTLLLLTLFTSVAFAQDEEVNNVGVRFLDYGNDLPADLLSTRTAVLVAVPTVASNSPRRGDWRALAEEAHPTFKELGIDAILYMNFEDVVSAGVQATQAYADYLNDRQVKNIIVLSLVRLTEGDKVDDRYVVAITPFSGDAQIIANGQKAWKDQSKSLNRIMRSLERSVSRADQPKTNNMIIDVPEYFENISLVPDRRFESFPLNLKTDRLAVPVFSPVSIPDDRPGGILNGRIEKEAESLNAGYARQTKELMGYMNASYPFEWDTVYFDGNEQRLIDEGFDYVLLSIYTTGSQIKEWLEYEMDPSVTTFVTVKQKDGRTIMRNIPADAPVYKYYVKHLYSGEVYVGKTWDADEYWKDAFVNHMSNLIQSVVRGR